MVILTICLAMNLIALWNRHQAWNRTLEREGQFHFVRALSFENLWLSLWGILKGHQGQDKGQQRLWSRCNSRPGTYIKASWSSVICLLLIWLWFPAFTGNDYIWSILLLVSIAVLIPDTCGYCMRHWNVQQLSAKHWVGLKGCISGQRRGLVGL